MAASSPVRPYGPLRWLLGKLPNVGSWTVIGSLSAEDRCLAAAQEVLHQNAAARCILLKIEPVPPRTTFFHAQSHKKFCHGIEKHLRTARQRLGSCLEQVKQCQFLCLDHEVTLLAEAIIKQCGPNVVLDISAMPKRFFFPLLTAIAASKDVVNLVATNTTPKKYGPVLAENAQRWGSFPGFGPDPFVGDIDSEEPSPEPTLVIAVGYQPLNIPELVDQKRFQKVGLKLLFPFPSLHPGFIPNWKFVGTVKEQWPKGLPLKIIRVPTSDVSLAFDHLVAESETGRTKTLVLAPFGPKPMSLAMCLLGIARNGNKVEGSPLSTEIGYTQPTLYHPDYSTGVSTTRGVPDVTAFCVRLNGRDLYVLP